MDELRVMCLRSQKELVCVVMRTPRALALPTIGECIHFSSGPPVAGMICMLRQPCEILAGSSVAAAREHSPGDRNRVEHVPLVDGCSICLTQMTSCVGVHAVFTLVLM
jgi:hypothetical protein